MGRDRSGGVATGKGAAAMRPAILRHDGAVPALARGGTVENHRRAWSERCSSNERESRTI